jgi:hypothetical protein
MIKNKSIKAVDTKTVLPPTIERPRQLSVTRDLDTLFSTPNFAANLMKLSVDRRHYIGVTLNHDGSVWISKLFQKPNHILFVPSELTSLVSFIIKPIDI